MSIKLFDIQTQAQTYFFCSRTVAYPGPPSAPKVASAFKDCINLTWSPPADTGGTNILGYNLEKRKKGSNLWGPVNPHNEMIPGPTTLIIYSLSNERCCMINCIDVLLSCAAKGYAVKDVVEGIEYEFRVAAINNSGAGEFSTPSEFVFARDPKSMQRCTKIVTVLKLVFCLKKYGM